MSATTNLGLDKPANGADVDSWDVPVNSNSDILDAFAGAFTTVNVVAATGTVALTATQYRPRQITFSGLLTANVNYQLPSGIGGQWSLLNSSTGAFSITFSSAGGGTTVTLAQGKRTFVQCDGTNVVTGAATSGANADITSLSALSTPLSVPQGGTGAATLTGILKGNGASAFTAATAGSDYVAPGTATAFTATQTFSGSSSTAALALVNALENATISATAATGTVNIYLASQSVLYYTSSAAANWIVNIALSAGTSLNAAMTTGQTVTLAFLVTQGATPYYATSIQVDGTTVGVTTKWQGAAPTAGSASGVDCYSFTILKTGSATFTVLASRASYA